MHDIKFIRATPDAFDAGLKRRGLEARSKEILALDEKKRARQTELQALQSKRNDFAKQIGMAKSKGENTDAIMAESKAVNDQLATLEAELAGRGELEAILETIPNLPADDVPEGKDEHGNKQVRVVGTKPSFSFKPKLHDELDVAKTMMDFDGAAKLSGARFVVLKNQLARMERALANFMLDIHTNEFGYSEHVVPLLVRDNAVYGTGQLPKFAEDLFKTENGYWLIPTSEVPLTNLVSDSILDEAQLPIRMTAYTPCFRSEAGAAGKDTRGMIRQHQFTKVELVSVTTPEQSVEEHERMTGCAEEILKRLGLHYRVMLLCTGDMGFSAQKTYDLEVWMPGADTFREISSCSNCGGFQARRMKARYKGKDKKETNFVHTLNGSGLAIGRTMVAILENYQQADGSIAIPEALQSYMGGLKVIAAKG
jgi:seryl-tRNA synthetase